MSREPAVEHLTLAERYAIIGGYYPIQKGDPNMVIELTDAQVARVLELCEKIAVLRQQLPPAPRGFDVSLEVAKHLRAVLESKSDLLLELGALLR
jgi:hypothetical protein